MSEPVEIPGGEVRIWIEQETVHLKAVSPYGADGDSVELTGEEAIKLAEALLALVKELEAHDSSVGMHDGSR